MYLEDQDGGVAVVPEEVLDNAKLFQCYLNRMKSLSMALSLIMTDDQRNKEGTK